MSYQTEIQNRIMNEDAFIEATFKGAQRGQMVAWERVTIRPVLLKNGRFLQFAYFDGRKEIAKNYAGDELERNLAELLDAPFKTMQVQDQDGRFIVQFSKKGKPIIHREKSQNKVATPTLSHDKKKNYLLPDNEPVPFLQAVGIMTKDGRVKANMRRKFRQINKFLQFVDETVDISEQDVVRVVDFGCGNAYLTLATYHYLHEIRGKETQMLGIDIKSDLMTRHNQNATELGWENLHFEACSIDSYNPETPPDIVLALHACDTATDDALAQGIISGSRTIFCAPCCHHHLQAQLHQVETPPLFDPMLRHGILKERFGDLLTDSFRALILRLMGYRTDVIEFISTEHTPRNLMIRAVKSVEPGEVQYVEELNALKSFWQVTPYLETLLRQKLSGFTEMVKPA